MVVCRSAVEVNGWWSIVGRVFHGKVVHGTVSSGVPGGFMTNGG